jgi:tetratricopeptide (TPR) repeat protein
LGYRRRWIELIAALPLAALAMPCSLAWAREVALAGGAEKCVSVAVAPFVTAAPLEGLAHGLTQEVAARLEQRSGSCVVSPAQVKAALRLLKLPREKALANGTLRRVGRLAGAEVLVAASISKRQAELKVQLTVVRPFDSAPAALKTLRGRTDAPRALEEGIVEAIHGVVGPTLGELSPASPEPLAEPTTAWTAMHRALSILDGQSLRPPAAALPATLPAAALAKAGAALGAALVADPTLAEAHVALALVATLSGQQAEAERELELGRQAPSWPRVAAFVAERQGALEAAEAILRDWVARRPRALLARVSLAEFYTHGGRLREATAALTETLALASRQPLPLALLAYGQARRQKLEEASAALERALALAPGVLELQLALAEVYLRAKRPGDALRLLRQARAKEASSRILLPLAYADLQVGNDTEAIETGEKALQGMAASQSQEAALAHAILARAWGHLGELDVAFEQLAAARRLGLTDRQEIEADTRLARLRADPRYANPRQ